MSASAVYGGQCEPDGAEHTALGIYGVGSKVDEKSESYHSCI